MCIPDQMISFKSSHGHLSSNLHNHTHAQDTRSKAPGPHCPVIHYFTVYQHYSSSTHIYTHKYLNILLYVHSSIDKNHFLHGILISAAHSKNNSSIMHCFSSQNLSVSTFRESSRSLVSKPDSMHGLTWIKSSSTTLSD